MASLEELRQQLDSRGHAQEPATRPGEVEIKGSSFESFEGSLNTPPASRHVAAGSPARTVRGKAKPQKPRNPRVAAAAEIVQQRDELKADLGFQPFSQTYNDTRAKRRIELSEGFDPADLAGELWHLITEQNQPPRLFMHESGGTLRLEIVDGMPRLLDLTADRLAHEVHEVATFAVEGSFVPCPTAVVKEMRAMPMADVPLPRLRHLATAPLVADTEGTILSDSGYYKSLRVALCVPVGLSRVPPNPTDAQVRQALAILKQPLIDFPFVGDESRATALAIMITPFVRQLINGPTPLHLIEKSTPGTGASLLTDALLTPAVGGAYQKMAAPTSEHEWQYTLGAVLRPLPSAVVIDNARELTSPQLAKALTDDVMVSRIVGSSDTAVVPVQCVWIATANNPTLHQEIARRVVRCRLDAGVERPWLGRSYQIPDLKPWLRNHRNDMVWAVLTLVRSWVAAGKPMGTETLGMFESYSQIIGGILQHAGIQGFLQDIAVADPTNEDAQSEAERWFVTEWFSRHADRPVSVTELLALVDLPGSPVLELWGPDVATANYGRRLGWFIQSIKLKTYTIRTAEGDKTVVRVLRPDTDPRTRTRRYRLQITK